MFQKLAIFLVLALAAPFAFAVDVSGVVTEINSAITPIGLIGAAVLLVLVAAKIYKWVRRAM
jgi:uncharacterized membrane protein